MHACVHQTDRTGRIVVSTLLLFAQSATAAPIWIGAWAAAPQPSLPGTLDTFDKQSVRLIVHAGTSGTQLRVRFSNAYGDAPLEIGAAHVARRERDAQIDPASDRQLLFGGRADVKISARAAAVSDPVALDVAAGTDLAVSVFFPRATRATTSHLLALQTSYVAAAGTGDVTGNASFPVQRTITTWPFLTGVDVAAPTPGTTIVAFGDSTVDGDGSTRDANRRLTDMLAARLNRSGRYGVLDEGIIGNRLLRGSPEETEFGAGFGESGLARFARDALDAPGVACVIVRIGTNDIAFPGALAPHDPPVAAEALAAGFRKLVALAHARGVRVVGTTLPPFAGSTLAESFHTAQKERVRTSVNAWLRTSGTFDAVVDADAALRDPDHPATLRADYDSGDHTHPNDAGYARLADAIPLDVCSRASR